MKKSGRMVTALLCTALMAAAAGCSFAVFCKQSLTDMACTCGSSETEAPGRLSSGAIAGQPQR